MQHLNEDLLEQQRMSNIPEMVQHRLHLNDEVQNIANFASLLQKGDGEPSDFNRGIV